MGKWVYAPIPSLQLPIIYNCTWRSDHLRSKIHWSQQGKTVDYKEKFMISKENIKLLFQYQLPSANKYGSSGCRVIFL